MGAVDNFILGRVKRGFDNYKRRGLEAAQERLQPNNSTVENAVNIGRRANQIRRGINILKTASILANPTTWVVLGVILVIVIGLVFFFSAVPQFGSSRTETQIEGYTDVAVIEGCAEDDGDCGLKAHCKNAFEDQELREACLEINQELEETTF